MDRGSETGVLAFLLPRKGVSLKSIKCRNVEPWWPADVAAEPRLTCRERVIAAKWFGEPLEMRLMLLCLD
jgi:hypothetical protein